MHRRIVLILHKRQLPLYLGAFIIAPLSIATYYGFFVRMDGMRRDVLLQRLKEDMPTLLAVKLMLDFFTLKLKEQAFDFNRENMKTIEKALPSQRATLNLKKLPLPMTIAKLTLLFAWQVLLVSSYDERLDLPKLVSKPENPAPEQPHFKIIK